MAGQSQARSSIDEAGLSEHPVIGKGADAIVRRSSGGRTVRKQYIDGTVDARTSRATLEFKALQKAASALSAIDGVRCPNPVDVDPAHGELVMEYFDGRQLNEAIAEPQFSEQQNLQRIAHSLADAFAALTGVLQIHHLDFSIRNTLLSDDGRELVLIDFTARPTLESRQDGHGIEYALASFLTSSLTFQIRRSTMFKRETGRRLRFIAREILHHAARRQPVDAERVQRIAWQYFWRQSGNRGWKRYLWFNSFGAAMFWSLLRLTMPENR